MSYAKWITPLSDDHLTLAQAKESLSTVSAKQQEIPLMVKLVENPEYKIPGVTLFHGAVDLNTHDSIHIILGRGLLAMDEAFTIGFTMGSTNKVTQAEEEVFGFIAKYFYPGSYKFSDDDISVFRNAVRLAYISNCQPLDTINYDEFLQCPIAEIRHEIGLETDLLSAYYRIEKKRYPQSAASQRLV